MTVHHPVTSKLMSCSLFREFGPSDLDRLLELAAPRLFPAGMEIVLKGDDGGAMYIVAAGEAQAVVHSPDALERGAARFKAGDFFGEMALLSRERHRVDVVAVTDCTVLTITSVLIRMLGHSSPSAGFRLAMGILELARQRLRSVDHRAIGTGSAVCDHADGAGMMERVA